jgi:hypothetical protein
MSIVKPGKYVAKVVDYGIPEIQPGKIACVALTFEFKDDTSLRQLTWFGYLSDAAIGIAIKGMITAGLKSNDLLTLLGPEAFHDKEVQITVENEEYDGKTRARIKWINEISGSKWKNMEPTNARTLLSQFTNHVGAVRKEMGSSEFAPAKDDFEL